ncbi:hypothetical protein ABZ484_15020 [Streptomyces sp. NPDC006393]|uniref:hypothetical protein n=1 Tax=Streptomyces sp. NPDC006393 TaxID=3156763 RepID=UPI0033C771B0
MGEHHGGRRQDRSDSAAGEILHEIEDAETDVDGSRKRRHAGEAAEAITPNERAQEESLAEAGDDRER